MLREEQEHFFVVDDSAFVTGYVKGYKKAYKNYKPKKRRR